MRSIRSFAVVAAAAALAIATQSFAAVIDIPIANGDFENPVLQDWDQTTPVILGWTFDGTPSSSGTKKDPYYMAPGVNSAYLRAGDPAIYQTTDWTIHTGDQFTLTTYFKSLWQNPDYALSLYAFDAGGNRTILATTTGGTTGGFIAATLPYTAPSAVAGQKIGIQIDSIHPSTGDAWLAVDNVALTVDAVPEPTSLVVLAGSALLLGRRRRSTK